MNNVPVMNDEVTRALRDVEAAKQRYRDAVTRATPQPVDDWTLRTVDGAPVRLSELFAGRRELILWHNMGRSCVYCTLWADALRGYTEALQSRAALVLTSPDEPDVLKEWARSRAWTVRCVSTAGTGMLPALAMADPAGRAAPGVSGLTRRDDGSIVRTAYTYFGPGDDFCPVWPVLDLLQGGRAGWEPQFRYRPDVTSVGVERAGRA